MAGGPFAAVLPCMECAGRAVRVYEGSEDDHYECERGHAFGIDWSRGSLPETPLWPPDSQWLAAFEQAKRAREKA